MTIGPNDNRSDAARGQPPQNLWACPICGVRMAGDSAQRDHLSQCMARSAMRDSTVTQNLANYYTDLYKRNNPNYDRDNNGRR